MSAAFVADIEDHTLLKYLMEHLIISIGNNVNPWPIDKPCISLDNKAETQFLLLSLQKSQSIESKKVFDKTISAQVHDSNFNDNDGFFWNSVESPEFVYRVT